MPLDVQGRKILPPGVSGQIKEVWINYFADQRLAAGYAFCSEKAMESHSSTLAWKIPWKEEPGRLQSMGSLRVGHD